MWDTILLPCPTESHLPSEHEKTNVRIRTMSECFTVMTGRIENTTDTFSQLNIGLYGLVPSTCHGNGDWLPPDCAGSI